MPLKLSRLLEETTTVEMPYLGETVSITWTIAGWTPELQDHLVSASSENDATQATVEALASLIVRWDLAQADGTPYPTTREQLAKLPKGFVLDVVRFLGESASPNPPSEPPSPDS